MRRWWGIGMLVLASVAGCGDDDPGAGSVEPVPATTFVWTTTMDQAGDGYELTVAGAVGADHATYTMQVDPRPGPGEGADVLAALAGVAVNGLAEEGVETSGGTVSTGGETEVRVLGDERWYRNPWLLGEAAAVFGDAEWVRVGADEAVIADLATAVLNERHDEALRRLLDAVEAGEPLVAPGPEEQSSELDEILSPWVGLRGPLAPEGAEATVTGDAARGTASWARTLTAAVDGVDGAMSATVEWGATSLARPAAPGPVVDAADLASALTGG